MSGMDVGSELFICDAGIRNFIIIVVNKFCSVDA